jgi:hypothetical protein
MSEKVEAWTILISILILSAGGYTIAWRSQRMWLRRTAALVVAVLAGMAAWAVTFGLALPLLGDLDWLRLVTPLWELLLENLAAWAFCFGAWFVTARLLLFAIRPQRNSRAIQP